jgi:uncharacterized protein YjdB
MPIRVQRPVPSAPVPLDAYPEPAQQPDTVVPWPAKEETAPSLFATPDPAPVQEEVRRQRPPEPVRAVPPAQSGYRSVPFAAEPGTDSGDGRRKISPVLIGAIMVALIAVGGIFWMVRSTMSLGGKSAQPVAITIFPTTAKVAAGKGVDFVAEVSGAPASEVTWTVEEGDSGGEVRSRGASAKDDKISLYCTYVAPKTPGTYHLTATSTADKSKSATADITVVAK